MILSLTNQENEYLIEIIKEEISQYIESGYGVENEYVQTLNEILNKLRR